MAWIIDNWYLIVALIAVIVAVVYIVVKFFKLPTEQQIACVKEWLKYAVTVAEKELQSGTGQLKLRLVYDMFLEKFPQIAKFISFEVFSEWVDEALVWLNKQLDSNKNIKAIVESDD